MTCPGRWIRPAVRVLAALGLLMSSSARAEWPSSSTFNVAICTAPGFQNAPRLVTDGAGGALVLWLDQRDGVQSDLYASRVLADGTLAPGWPAQGRAICLAPGNITQVQVRADGSGGALIAWSDFRSGAGSDIYAHHLLADGSLDPLWPVDGLLVCAADSSQFLSSLLLDGTGGMVLAWADLRSRSSRDVYLQHVLAPGVVDPSWPACGLAVSTGAGDQTGAQLVASGSDGVLVVWSDARSGSADIVAHRVLTSGALDPTWPAGGRLVCSATGDQFTPALASDDSGGALVAWQDFRSGTADVYTSRVLSNGSPDAGWPADGLGLCTAAGEQSFIQLVETAPGEAIAVWRDMRGAHRDIYAARLLVMGADPAWPANGRGVCLELGDQTSPVAAADGLGGAILAWQDNRIGAGSADVYAHRVQADGTLDPLWPVGGRPVGAAGGSQQGTSVLADGAGGAILAWHDGRSGATDIYAQRVQPNGLLGGTVVSVEPSAALAFALRGVQPNPARSGALRVDFSLAVTGEVSLELVDVAGRRLEGLALGTLAPGRHTATIRPVRRLPAGIAFLRLRQGPATLRQRVVLLD